ncbi:hypothetical protein OROMI_033967 [Orobanche minor]
MQITNSKGESGSPYFTPFIPLNECVNNLGAMKMGRRSMNAADDLIDERIVHSQFKNLGAMKTGRRSMNAVDDLIDERNVHSQENLGAMKMGRQSMNAVDDLIDERNVHSQSMTRRRQSTRNANNSQEREQSILDADNRVGIDGISKLHKTRGFTYMPRVYAISSNNNSQSLKVELNEYGKPIGPNKSKFVEFLAFIARNGKVAPLNYPDLHKVPKTEKSRMMDMIK